MKQVMKVSIYYKLSLSFVYELISYVMDVLWQSTYDTRRILSFLFREKQSYLPIQTNCNKCKYIRSD